MSLFSDLGSVNNAHWVSPPNSGSENAVVGSTSPPGFDPTVARPSQGSPVGRDASYCQFDFLNTTRSQPSTGPGVQLSREEQFFCKVCKVTLSGLEPAKQHYAGKQHRKAVQVQEAGQTLGDGSTLPLESKVCQKKFTGQASSRQHHESSKHKTAVEGAAVWAKTQGQIGTSSAGATNQRPPPGFTALAPAAKEDFNIPILPGTNRRTTVGALSNNAAPDEVSRQYLHKQSAPGALPNVRAAGGDLQQAMRNLSLADTSLSTEDYALAVGPGNQLLRQHVAKVCSSVLQRYLMQLIPDLTDKITDKVLEELSKTPPVDVLGREAAAQAPPGQNGSAEDPLQSVSTLSTDYQGMPSLRSAFSLNSLDARPREGGNVRRNLSQDSPTNYDNMWETLKEKNK